MWWCGNGKGVYVVVCSFLVVCRCMGVECELVVFLVLFVSLVLCISRVNFGWCLGSLMGSLCGVVEMDCVVSLCLISWFLSDWYVSMMMCLLILRVLSVVGIVCLSIVSFWFILICRVWKICLVGCLVCSRVVGVVVCSILMSWVEVLSGVIDCLCMIWFV